MAYVYYEQLINRFLSKLDNLGASSVNCNISIGSITGFFGENCNLKISNSCLNNQNVINSLLLASLAEVLEIIPDENTKNSIKGYLGITDMNNIISAQFQTQCNALATINNNINILQLNFSKCIASSPLTLSFVNTGEARSACGLTSILNAFLSVNENIVESSNLVDTTFMAYVILGLCIVAILVIIVLYFSKPDYLVEYVIDNKEKNNSNLQKLFDEMKEIVEENQKE